MKRKRLKHLRLLFAIVLTSCVTVPDVPPGEKCLVIAFPGQDPHCRCVNAQTGEDTRTISIEECNLYIAVSPEYGEKIDAYHQALIELARRRCRQ